MVHCIAFGRHLEGGIRQVLTHQESALLVSVMTMFKGLMEMHLDKSLADIRTMLEPMVKKIPLTQEEVDARLQKKKQLDTSSVKTLIEDKTKLN